MPEAWWLRASDLQADYERRAPPRVDPVWYRFADGWLVLESEDEALSRRFQQVYPEGASAAPAGPADIVVKCSVRVNPDAPAVGIIFTDPEPLDAFAFCAALFPDRGYVEGPPGVDGWRTFATRQAPDAPETALRESSTLADSARVWQPFVGNYAVNRVLRLQRDILFFHAASIAVEGRGVMIVGAKASGKTTSALTLASRGHDFLGDEMAAVHRMTKAMQPFRRAVSIRSGPLARKVAERLEQEGYPTETFPDGGARTLVNMASLFPQAGASPAPLSCVLFLRRFAPRAAAESFAFGMEHFRMLSPLGCSMWGASLGARMLDMSRLMRGVRCYFLDPGDPEETAALVEQIAMGRYAS